MNRSRLTVLGLLIMQLPMCTLASIGCFEPPGAFLGLRQPRSCATAERCVSACMDQADDPACLWIAFTIDSSELGFGSNAGGRLHEAACARSPALCIERWKRDESVDCSTDFAGACIARLEEAADGTDNDPGNSRATLVSVPDAAEIVHRACEAGDYGLCWRAVVELEDAPEAVPGLTSALRATISSHCETGEPEACDAQSNLELREGGDESRPRATFARMLGLLEDRCRSGGSWSDCSTFIAKSMDPLTAELELDHRREEAGRRLRITARSLLAAYFGRICDEGNVEACRDARTVRLALAEDGADGGNFDADLAALDKECFKAGRYASCIAAGNALLAVEGETALPLARRWFRHACGHGGCQALVNAILRSDFEGSQLNYWRERGCDAGEQSLCPIPGLENQYIIGGIRITSGGCGSSGF